MNDDLISRQAVIDAICHHFPWLSRKESAEVLHEAPSAQPKTGRWERYYSRPNVLADLWWYCSECGYKNSNTYANIYHNYCPNCGAKMGIEYPPKDFMHQPEGEAE